MSDELIPADYPIGLPAESAPQIVDWTAQTWGTAATFDIAAPSLRADAAARVFHGRLQRLSVSPGAVAKMQAMLVGIDVRSVLPTLTVPTLVLHRRGDAVVPVEHGRYLAEHIPGARLVELGTLSAEEAENHPRKNELQQAIGGQPDVEPGVYSGELKPGDWVLVCSDGLTNHVKSADLEAMLMQEAWSAETAARRLVNLTNIEGATDNATVVVVRCT